LINLLSNAVKFTDKGDITITVTGRTLPLAEWKLGGQDGAPPLGLQPWLSLHELHFAVKDTGLGIPRDRMDRLFKSFSQVDASTTRRFGGTGLGLVISKRLAEMMGGAMWVESEGVPGKGATFHFTIQAMATGGMPPVYLSSEQPHLSERRVLIVDDNATNRKMLLLQTQSWGMKPVVVESGAAALELLTQGEVFDLAVLDMQMPEMDGLMLAQAIRELEQHTQGHAPLPLVMLTSLGPREASLPDNLFVAFLTKPIKASQLYNALVEVFADETEIAAARRRLQKAAPASEFDANLSKRLPLRILLAEDNAVNQKLALLLLERMGYRADVAANGLEVLMALDRQPYDIVLMDVQMPEMDGLEATEKIRANFAADRQPRIIAMTANAMQGDRDLCLRAGMNDYVSKPVQVAELTAALERWATKPMAPTPITQAESLPLAPLLPDLSQEPVLDQRVLASLRAEQMPGELDLVKELMGLYLEESVTQMAQIREAVAQHAAQPLRHAAHTLKGSSASLGVKQVAAVSAALENLGRVGKLEQAEALVQALETAYQRAVQALEAER
jgi:CheY-like chemotaxis protein/HPt (histidine-containing phosphotransfer) domain-containing protein